MQISEIKETINEALVELMHETQKVTLTIEEAAKYSGIGRDNIKKLICAKTSNFPHFRISNKTYINRKKLEQWLESSSERKSEYFT